jgi:hypothetical protein
MIGPYLDLAYAQIVLGVSRPLNQPLGPHAQPHRDLGPQPTAHTPHACPRAMKPAHQAQPIYRLPGTAPLGFHASTLPFRALSLPCRRCRSACHCPCSSTSSCRCSSILNVGMGTTAVLIDLLTPVLLHRRHRDERFRRARRFPRRPSLL